MEIIQVIIAGTFSLLVALGSVWFKHVLDGRKKASDEAAHEDLSGSYIDDMVGIQNFIQCFLDKWNLDRIGIYQFHNGGKFFHGVSMKKYSQTFEATSHGIVGLKCNNQMVMITDHPHLIKSLNEKEFFSVDIEDPTLDYKRPRLEEAGVLQIIYAPIKAISGQLMGFLSIEMVKHKIPITQELEDEISELVTILSGYLIRK